MLKGSRAKGQTAEQRRHETHLTNSSQQEGSKDLPMGAGAPAAAPPQSTRSVPDDLLEAVDGKCNSSASTGAKQRAAGG